MKNRIKQLLLECTDNLIKSGKLSSIDHFRIQIDHGKDNKHGDFASNIALANCKQVGLKPRDFAQLLIDHLPSNDFIEKVEIAGPGFINFFLTPTAQHAAINEILDAGEAYGICNIGNQQKILLEFVSANPTGPLHVGHGRGAAIGASLANILVAVGYDIHKEYYVNDAGRQMDILATSIWLRYLELFDENFTFPRNGYKGSYVIGIAKMIQEQYGNAFHQPVATIFTDKIPADETDAGDGDKEAHIDGLIQQAKQLLGEENYQRIHQLGLNQILDGIKDDLAEFRVDYQEWYSERRLFANQAIDQAVATLTKKDLTYKRDGHLWFNATAFGDEKDRVLIRKNGVPTYFASDMAYHYDKFQRGTDRIIDIFGADHHGYIPRIKAAMIALGIDEERFDFITVQFATLWRGEERVQMSTRSGSFVTLSELCQEVGPDAARFFYVMRKAEQHMDFDLELAKSQSNENPVYYIQYAHARICSVFNQLLDKELTWSQDQGVQNLSLLTTSHEKTMIATLAKFPEIIVAAARNYEPHLIAHYLRELANDFHSYYNAHQFIVDDESLRNARLCLAMACKIVIANGLDLLNVSAPQAM